MMAAVFGPIPGSSFSHALASSIDISWRKSRSRAPLFSIIRLRTCLIRGALILASPPTLMEAAISSRSARAISSKEPKVSISCLKALSELTSEVCWERMQETTSDMGSSRGPVGKGPYSSVSIPSTVGASRALLPTPAFRRERVTVAPPMVFFSAVMVTRF